MAFGRVHFIIMATLAAGLAAVMFACGPARAQDLDFLGNIGGFNAQVAPDADTSPEMIAKIWYRLAGKTPDFAVWASHTEEYKKADMLLKETVQEEKAAELAEGFNLLVPGDQIVAHFDAQLSEYSVENQGYLIENVTPLTFIKIEYAGEKFALVPSDFYEAQWLPMEAKAAQKVDTLRLASESGTHASLALFLSPQYAEGTPVTLDDGQYKVLSADILILAFYNEEGEALWRKTYNTTAPENAQQQQDLLNLYQ